MGSEYTRPNHQKLQSRLGGLCLYVFVRANSNRNACQFISDPMPVLFGMPAESDWILHLQSPFKLAVIPMCFSADPIEIGDHCGKKS